MLGLLQHCPWKLKKTFPWFLRTLCLLHISLLWLRPASAMDCEDLNANLMMLKQEINFHQLTEDNADAIMDHFFIQIDPMKHYFLHSDVEELRAEFEFQIGEDDEIRINCEHIDYLADVAHLRMQEMVDFLKELDLETLNPEHQKLLMRNESYDFATGPNQLIIRWQKQAMYERLLLEESFKDNRKLLKNHIIHRKILDIYKGRTNWLDPKRTDYSLYYHLFLRAVFNTFEYFAKVHTEENIKSLILHHHSSQNDNIQSFESNVIVLKNPLEPYWRVIAPNTVNNPSLLESDIFLPGDIILATTKGKHDLFYDLNYLATLAKFYETASTTNHHRKKFLILRPNPQDKNFALRVVSMPLSSLIVASTMMSQGYIVGKDSEVFPSDDAISVGLVKIPFMPPSKSPPDEGSQRLQKMIGNIEPYIESSLANGYKLPKAIVLDFRNFELESATHQDYYAAIKFLSYFLPDETPLGFIHLNTSHDAEPQYFALASEVPDILQDKPELHKELQNIPLTILVSGATQGYTEWVAGVMAYYKRALIVGDKNTLGQDTILNNFHGISHTPMMFSLNNIRLYLPHGKSVVETGPLSSHVYIPSTLPHELPIQTLYSPEDSQKIYNFEPEEPAEELRDFLPERVIAPLQKASKKRVENHPALKRHLQMKELAEQTLSFQADGVPLYGQGLEYVISEGLEKETEPLTTDLLNRQLMEHDPVLMEAVQVTYDYYHLLLHGESIEDNRVLKITALPKPKQAKQKNSSSDPFHKKKKSDKKKKSSPNSGGFN